jgi:hypothetical protein
MLPSTREQFFAVFAGYNLAVWPAPLLESAFVVPLLWSAVRVQAAVLLGVPKDLALGVAGLLGIALMLRPLSAA